ncbi:hypothetical protein BGZ59_003219 [Podila verticillata]|nr:hypothetical protein BGZ59_003219 [Podila verticillata]
MYAKLGNNDNNSKKSANRTKSRFRKTEPHSLDRKQDKKSSLSRDSDHWDSSGKSGSSYGNKKYSKSKDSKPARDKGNDSEKEHQ